MALFCHHCGAGEQSGDAYCKRCGEWLPSTKGLARHGFGATAPEQNLRTILWLTACSAATALILAILFFVAGTGDENVRLLLKLARSFFFVIAAWQFAILYSGYKLQQRIKRGRAGAPAPAIDAKRDAPALNEADLSGFPRASLVTEHTTELLNVETRAREREKSNG